MKHNSQTDFILSDRFGKDSLIALATVEDGIPHVRTVDAVYIDGAFYVVTYSLSGKMQQLAADQHAAICGEWFTANALGENIGHVRAPENAALAVRLRDAFSSWYGNGRVDGLFVCASRRRSLLPLFW